MVTGAQQRLEFELMREGGGLVERLGGPGFRNGDAKAKAELYNPPVGTDPKLEQVDEGWGLATDTPASSEHAI